VTNNLAVAGLSTGKVVALDNKNGVPVWESRVAIPQGRSELDAWWTSTVACCCR
jgi:outer membrane protein assembly factor BamB